MGVVVVVAVGSFDWGGGGNITKSSNNARRRRHQRGMRTFKCVLTRRHNGAGWGGVREGADGAHSDGVVIAAWPPKSGAEGRSADQK